MPHIIKIDYRTSDHFQIPWRKISATCQVHAMYFHPDHLRELWLKANKLYPDRFELSPKGKHAVLHLKGTEPAYGQLNFLAAPRGRRRTSDPNPRLPIDPNDDTPRDHMGHPLPFRILPRRSS